MAGKFHVNDEGRVMPCSAQSGNCPFGDDDQHFDNFEEAQLAADKKNELLTKGNDDRSSSKTQEETKMSEKLKLNTNEMEIIEGILYTYGLETLQNARNELAEGKYTKEEIVRAVAWFRADGLGPYEVKKNWVESQGTQQVLQDYADL